MTGSVAAATDSQFQVVNGAIAAATGTPVPASGTHATLLSNGSVATTTVAGGGQVVVGALGEWCGGMPIIRVTVDGVFAGSVRLTSATTYVRYTGGRTFPQGVHQVRIVMINDHSSTTCDRNAHIGYAHMQHPTPPPPPPSGQPGPANTGVPEGTSLRTHNGDLTITEDGTVIDGMDIHGFVDVRADNVVITRSVIRGGRDPGTVNRSLIAAHGDHVNLVITDSTLVASHPTPYVDGLKGRNFTATRLDISNVIDTVMILGDNATVRDSWLHDNAHFSPDPRQSDNRSHDDSVQIEGGNNILLQNNTMADAHNAAVMITQNYSVSANISILNNSISHGSCSINIAEKGRGPIQLLTIASNRFAPPVHAGCAVLVPRTSEPTMVNNVWVATGNTVAVTFAD